MPADWEQEAADLWGIPVGTAVPTPATPPTVRAQTVRDEVERGPEWLEVQLYYMPGCALWAACLVGGRFNAEAAPAYTAHAPTPEAALTALLDQEVTP